MTDVDLINLGSTERLIMAICWNFGREVSVRDVWRRLQAVGYELAYTTVATQMNRLVEKGFLDYRATRRTLRAKRAYAPTFSVEEVKDLFISQIDSLLNDV